MGGKVLELRSEKLIKQGRNQERTNNLATITKNLMARDPSLSKREAEKRAKDLLK